MAMLPKPKLRSPYNYDRNEASHESALACPESSKTDQSYKEEVDINTIVRNFNVTNTLPQAKQLPEYGDFTGVDDYQTALLQINAANTSFMELPAHMRERFHHNPAEMLNFLEDPRNKSEAISLGLLNKPIEAAPPAAPAPSATE